MVTLINGKLFKMYSGPLRDFFDYLTFGVDSFAVYFLQVTNWLAVPVLMVCPNIVLILVNCFLFFFLVMGR